MNRNYLNLCVISILALFPGTTVGLEAIIGGKEAKFKAFRYIASVMEYDYGHICGGAIIGDIFVLSAAHCFMYADNTFKNNRVYVLMGTIDLEKKMIPAFNSEVTNIYVPKEFHAHDINSTADIAVLKLKEAMPIAYFNHLKLAYLGKNRIKHHSGEKATIAGWGWNKIELKDNHTIGNRTDSLLRFAIADVFSHEQCQQEHPTLKITEDHLCAKVEQHQHEVRGVCVGDDGGPLVVDGYVIGVLSKFPDNCAERVSSAIYTRVSHYLTFIRNVKENRLTKNMREHELIF